MEFIKPKYLNDLNVSDLQDFEQENQISLPKDYVDFLKKYNGGKPSLDFIKKNDIHVKWIYGMYDEYIWQNLFWTLDNYQNRIPDWYMPIGVDIADNILIQSLYPDNKGLIALWHHDGENISSGSDYYENCTFVSDSFSDFVNMLS